MEYKLSISLLLFLLATFSIAADEKIHIKNGDVLSGDILRKDAQSFIISCPHGLYRVPIELINDMQFDGKAFRMFDFSGKSSIIHPLKLHSSTLETKEGSLPLSSIEKLYRID